MKNVVSAERRFIKRSFMFHLLLIEKKKKSDVKP